ncbi:hypothetical protein, partial [Duganella sp. BK701]|uniref:hypothetical protein n=1 Tax=Duganella sp. BK701 TaxID=2512166 RepID=UPI001A9306CE
PLPIPNRTVKRLYADDSAATSVKVGYRQASYSAKKARSVYLCGPFCFGATGLRTVLICGNERCTMCPFALASNLNEK